MRKWLRHSAFSLVELLVVMAIILLLGGALLGVGKYMTVRASIDLTESELQVLTTALQQYYADTGAFPFDTDVNGNGAMETNEYDQPAFETDLSGVVMINGSPGTLAVDDVSGSALFYFLDQNPSSRTIVEALTDSLISNKDASGQAITITIGANPAIDLPRFVDAWGTSIRYEYLPGTAFPILTSAGPDKVFDTPDDITS